MLGFSIFSGMSSAQASTLALPRTLGVWLWRVPWVWRLQPCLWHATWARLLQPWVCKLPAYAFLGNVSFELPVGASLTSKPSHGGLPGLSSSFASLAAAWPRSFMLRQILERAPLCRLLLARSGFALRLENHLAHEHVAHMYTGSCACLVRSWDGVVSYIVDDRCIAKRCKTAKSCWAFSKIGCESGSWLNAHAGMCIHAFKKKHHELHTCMHA